MDTYGTDRQMFFRRLRTNLRFLLRHAGFIIAAGQRRVGTRLRLALHRRHHGAKSWPSRLLQVRKIICKPIPATQLANLLPQYVIARQSPQKGNGGGPLSKVVTQTDTEDYFAEHRWGFLLQTTLEDGGGGTADLERIGKWIVRYTDRENAAWETYSACERVANSLVLLGSMPRQDWIEIMPASYIDFLCGSLEWIYAHLEYYGEQRTNNHILNNARALVMGGAVLGNADAVDAGVKIFRAFLPKLITTGGYLRERSSHYQLIVLNWVLDARYFLKALGHEYEGDVAFLEDYAVRMSVAGALFVFGDGKLCATIGDVSPDFTPVQTSARLLSLYQAWWPPKRQPFQMCVTKDGWFRLSTGEGVVLGNFMGDVYPPNYPTHGHNDLTSFVWNEGATTILADPGRFRYTPDPVSIMQKSAMWHNVPILNGFAPFCETLLPNGELWPRPYAYASAEITIERDGIALSHDGFSRATSVQRHERRISLKDATLEVVDIFEGEGTAEVDFCWQFSSTFDTFDESILSALGHGIVVAIEMAHPVTRQAIVPTSCETVPLFESWRYGEATPSLGVRLKLPLILPAKILTRFSVSQCAV